MLNKNDKNLIIKNSLLARCIVLKDLLHYVILDLETRIEYQKELQDIEEILLEDFNK